MKITEFSIKNIIFINLITLFIYLAGGIAMFNLQRDAFPNISFDQVTVQADYPGATAEDVAYLLEETNQLLPGLGLAKERIVTTFAGVRPLAAGRDGDRVPWQMSRTHRLHEDPNGLLSIVGGKYTTYRAIAEEVVDRVVRRLGRAPIACRTAEAPLAAVRGAGPPGTASLCPHHAFTPADVRRAVEQEAAITLSDVLWRRLEVAWAPCQGLDCADAAARVMAESLGWDAVGIHRQVETYRVEVLANHVP